MTLDVAIFMPSFQGGGAEKVAVHVAGALAARGYAVSFVVGRATGPYRPLVSEAVAVADLGVPLGGGGFVRAVVPLARYLRRMKPRRVLAVANEANLVALLAARLAGYEGVVTSEHTHLSRALAEFSPLKGRLLRAASKALYPGAARTIAIADVVSNDLVKAFGLPSERVSVVHNPVLSDDDASGFARPWPRPYLLSVGRLAPPKDYDTLLRAFALSGARRTHDLVLLGEGPLRADVEARAREAGIEDRVHLVGFTDPRPYFAFADAFVLSSRFEGLPNVLVEALSYGLPIVVTDDPAGGGPTEAIGGRFGRVVPIGDAVRLGHALDAALASPRVGGEDLEAHLARFRLASAVDGYERALFGGAS